MAAKMRTFKKVIPIGQMAAKMRTKTKYVSIFHYLS
jgi:hypothetical protein